MTFAGVIGRKHWLEIGQIVVPSEKQTQRILFAKMNAGKMNSEFLNWRSFFI